MTDQQQLATRIKIALMARGYRQTDIAAECDVAPGTVSAVISGRSRSQRIETRIAAITGLSLAELWPQWHGAKTRRRRPVATSEQIATLLRAAAG